MKIAQLRYEPASGWSGLPDPSGAPPGDATVPSEAGSKTLVIAFGASQLGDESQIFDELASAYPGAVIVGCSTAGQMADDDLQDDVVIAAAVTFESVDVRSVALQSGPGVDSLELGKELATSLHGAASQRLTAMIVLGNGIHVNGSALVDGIASILPDDILVTGGLAADDDRFERTWVLHGDDPDASRTVAVGLYGESLTCSHGTEAGWDQFGPSRTITRSDANVLYEIDGQPALDLYKLYLGDHADDLPAAGLLFPLEVHPRGRPDDAIVRTILGVDEDEKSLIFAGDVPQGFVARLMKASVDRLVDGASRSAESARIDPSRPVLAIAISCVGRRLVLRERTTDELEAVLQHLPKGSELIGFYSYGEIAPRRGGNHPFLHNQTMTLTILSED